MKSLIAALTLRFNDRLSSPARAAASAVGGIERAQKMAAGASAQWDRALGRVDGQLNRLANASLVVDGIGRAGEQMIRPLADGVRDAAAFGRGMTGIGITAQMTDGQLQPLRRTILDTASELGALPSVVQSAFASVLAEGVYKTERELTAAGRSVSRFQKLAATMSDPISGQEAGGLSAGLANSFNIRADRLDQANAMLNRASQRGGVGIGVQARFLPAQAAAMRGLGGNSERGLADLMAATQVSKNAAGSSEQAANNLSNLLAALTSPETLRNFTKMGVNLENEIKAGLTRGISPLETVATVTDRLTKGGDQFRLGELFGDRQARDGAMALVQQLDNFRDISRDLRAEGTLKAYYADLDRALQGPAASFERYTSGVARAGIATGTILAPVVGVVADGLGRLANWMSRASESGNLLAKAAVWTVAGLAGIAVGAGFVGHAIIGVLGPLFIMKSLLGADGLGGSAAKQMFAQVVGGFARMRLAAIGFNLAMLANPVGIAIAAAVVVAVGAAILIRKYWQPISAFFTGVGQALGEAFGPALTAIGGWLRPLKPLWDGIVGGVSQLFDWIGKLLTPVRSTQAELTGATNAGRRFGQMLVGALRVTPIGMLVTGITMGIRVVRTVLGWRPMSVIGPAWAGVSGFFGGMAGRFVGYGRSIMQGLISGVRGMLGAVRNAVVGTASAAVSGFKAVLGIRSPSRVFAGLGGDTMAGLALGLRRGGNGAIREAGAVGAALISVMPVGDAPGFDPRFPPPDDRGGPPPAAGAGAYRSSMTIGDVTIHVTVQGGGSDARAQGGAIGRAAGDAFRARLFDGAGA